MIDPTYARRLIESCVGELAAAADHTGELIAWNVVPHPVLRDCYMLKLRREEPGRTGCFDISFDRESLPVVRQALLTVGLVPLTRAGEVKPGIVETWV